MTKRPHSRPTVLPVMLVMAAGMACATAADTPPPAPPAPASTSAAGIDPDAGTKARAAELAKKLIIVDGHVDLPYRLSKSMGADGSIGEDIIGGTESGDFDYPRAVRGGLDAPFMSIYVPAEYQQKGGARALADELIDLVEKVVALAPDRLAIARSPAEVRQNVARGILSLPLGIENGAAIEGSLDNLRHFHARGVRYMTLTHGKNNDICDSSYDKERTWKGLSPFGKQVVAEMNRLGIMIDISHVSDDVFHQVIELSQTPVIASHSSARHFVPGFERNMSDEMIVRLAQKGGVMMINFGSAFISAEAQAASDAMYAAATAFATENGLSPDDPEMQAFRQEYVRTHPMPLATIEDVANHIDHAVKLAGIDHVGLGSDFEGVGPTLPERLRDVSMYPELIAVLLGRGYSESDIEKICGGNALRVWQAVEDHARQAR